MSTAVRVPSLGPIVGHTTHNSCRIWIRGNEGDDSRTIGIASLMKGGAHVPDSARYFRLKREYDRTGTTDFVNLEPEAEYTVLTGSLSLDTEDPLESLPDAEVWATLPPAENWVNHLQTLDLDLSSATVRTFPEGEAQTLSFCFGSCRYPGMLWTKKRADQIFKAIHGRLTNPGDGTRPRFFMMVGDQIYADILPKGLGVSVADTENEFQERYLSAFGAPHTRTLLSNTPTYMILDDHEIEDNWTQGRIRDASKRGLFNMAIQAYRSYQWCHGPRNGDPVDERGSSSLLYYHFEAGGFPLFVVDGRTQRIRDDEDYDLTDNHLLGRPDRGTGYKGQIDFLCDWLDNQQKTRGDRPKFIVTASVFVPNEVRTTRGDRQKSEDDSWAAFPNTRKQLLSAIVRQKVQNVVFLSGDIHCSNVAEIRFAQGGVESPLRAFSVTSSAFYWPYPFADGNPLDYVHDSTKENDDFEIGDNWTMSYRARGFKQEDNFTQVDVDWPQKILRVRNFGRDGEEIKDSQTLVLA